MKFFTLMFFVLLCCFNQIVYADIISPTEYGFGESDPLRATIGSAAIRPKPSVHQDFKLKVRNRRLAGFEGDRFLKLRYFPAGNFSSDSSQLAIVIAGLGGSNMSNVANYLASELQLQGLSTVVIPNTLTKNFSISSSRSGLVGTAAEDSKDVYEVIGLILQKFKDEGKHFSAVRLIGYSHGALLAAYVHAQDRRQHGINIKSTLLINPPVDLLYGVRTLDRFSESYKRIPFTQKAKLLVRLGSQLLRQKRYATTEISQANFLNRISDDRQENEGLIGKILMSSLSESILASQSVTNLHLLPDATPTSDDMELLDLRRSAVKKLSFETYVLTFFKTLFLREGMDFSIDELNRQNSLYQFGETFAQDPSIHVMHNLDDFLLKDGDGQWLEGVFGQRARLYPRGGHMGNIWYPENLGDLISWVQKEKF